MYLTGVLECEFVQHYKESTRTERVYFDDVFWDSVKKELVAFVCALRTVMSDEKAQDLLVVENIFPVSRSFTTLD